MNLYHFLFFFSKPSLVIVETRPTPSCKRQLPSQVPVCVGIGGVNLHVNPIDRSFLINSSDVGENEIEGDEEVHINFGKVAL